MNVRLVKNLFFLIIFLIPLNLGKHFISAESYASKQLVDYLVPTIWFTDILVFVLLAVWIFNKGHKKIFKHKYLRFFVLFPIVMLPSVVISDRLLSSSIYFLRTILYLIFMYFVIFEVSVNEYFLKIAKIFAWSVFFLSLLAFAQWEKQGALFNDYLFFGEQPYSSATFNVARTSVFGKLKIPAYGTFRHPNIFGGFLAIALTWLYYFKRVEKRKFLFVLLLGTLALYFTTSLTAIFAYIFGVLGLRAIEKYGKSGAAAVSVVTFFVFVIGLFLPLFNIGKASLDPSFYRRKNLHESSFMMLENNSLFGVGLNNFSAHVNNYAPGTQLLRFVQPVHNIFLLIFAEAGIFALVSFLFIFIIAYVSLLSQSFGPAAALFVSVSQLVILGSFDHYLLTIQQTQLLFWLTVGLSLTYTNVDVEV